jgi:hypothetical protein
MFCHILALLYGKDLFADNLFFAVCSFLLAFCEANFVVCHHVSLTNLDVPRVKKGCGTLVYVINKCRETGIL